MRKRSDFSGARSEVSTYYVVRWNNANPIYSPPLTKEYEVHRSTIVDVAEKVWLRYGRRRTLAYKPVSQQVRHLIIDDEGLDYTYPDPAPYYSHAYGVKPSHWYSVYLAQVCNLNTVMNNYGLAKVANATDPYEGHYQRWESVRPTMATRANLAVFLAELRDIRRMFEVLPIKHFLLGNTPVKSWGELLKYVNNQHLNYNFGWKPFLRDLKAFRKAVDGFDSRLRRFVNNEMRPLVRRSSQPSGNTQLSGTTAVGPCTLSWNLNYEITRSSSFMFHYELPKYSDEEFRWRAWADALGANPTAANVWALVPWSFVVDWFVDVGGFLDTFSTDWLEPVVVYLQACCSVKVVGEASVTLTGPSSWGSPTGKLATERFSVYTRNVGVPEFTWDSQSLNADKIRLLASLALSRVL